MKVWGEVDQLVLSKVTFSQDPATCCDQSSISESFAININKKDQEPNWNALFSS